MKKTTLCFALFALSLMTIATSTAFAESQEDHAPISYTLKYSADGKEVSHPLGRIPLEYGRMPIYISLEIGGNPRKQEAGKLITFFANPKWTNDGLRIKGAFSLIEGELQESVRVDQVVKRGEDTTFVLKMNDKVYKAVLNVEY